MIRVARNAFTLVELLIVVVILGILAAVALPHFSDASEDAMLAGLKADLRHVRLAIRTYTVQHEGRNPNIGPDGLPRDTQAGLRKRLTQTTDKSGKLTATGELGPYLNVLPSNPFAIDPDKADNVRMGTAAPPVVDAGWYFNTSTVKFSANSAGHANL